MQDLALGFEADLAIKVHLALGFETDLAVKVHLTPIYVSAFRVATAASCCRQRNAAITTLKADTYIYSFKCICF